MSNQNGWETQPGSERWEPTSYPQQQFPQQNYSQPNYQPNYQPQYPQQPPQNNRGNGPLIAIIVLLVALLLAAVGALAFLGGAGAFRSSSEPVTSTIVETHTLPREAQQPQQAPQANSEPARKTYRNYSPATSVTSGPFAANVFDTFVAAYNSTGKTNISIDVYSPVTEKTYTMSCSGGDTVYCSGGNNAKVKIW